MLRGRGGNRPVVSTPESAPDSYMLNQRYEIFHIFGTDIQTVHWFVVQITGDNWTNIEPMVLILDGKSEIGAHEQSNICYLMCLDGKQ